MSLFDLDREQFDRSLEFHVKPRSAGGWDAVASALVRLLERCTAAGLWWATIDLGDEGRITPFAHLGPDEGGRLWTEVSANFHLPEEDWLTAEQKSALLSRGWKPPLDEEGMENFHRSFGPDEVKAACTEVLNTLRDVYGFADSPRSCASLWIRS